MRQSNTALQLEYLMESEEEANRLDEKFDNPSTIQQLKDVGILKCKSVLDVGCGTGKGSALMAELLGKEASVMGLDLSKDRIKFGNDKYVSKHGNLKLTQGSALQMPFKDNSFDFSWSRFLFEYLENPEKVLSEMVRVTKVGGKVVVGDLDHNCQMFYPFPDHLKSKWDEIFNYASGKKLFDKDVGRKLFKMFFDSGLKDIKVHFYAHHLIAGPMTPAQLQNWTHKLDAIKKLGSSLFKNTKELEAFCKEIHDLWLQKDFFMYSPLIIVEGKKP